MAAGYRKFDALLVVVTCFGVMTPIFQKIKLGQNFQNAYLADKSLSYSFKMTLVIKKKSLYVVSLFILIYLL